MSNANQNNEEVEEIELTEAQLQEATEKLRELFAKTAKEKAAKYCESDVNRVAEDDVYCHRFVKHQSGCVKKSLKMVKASLKWRKQFGVNDIKESTLNPKCFEANGLYPFFKDLEGRENLLLLVKEIYWNDELKIDDIKKFFVYWLELLEKRNDNKGITMIANCSGAGMDNIDMGLLWFFVNVLTTYYPYFTLSIVVYDMPPMFSAVWKLVKAMLPKEHIKIIKFVDKESVFEHVDAKNLPVSMGGTNTYVYTHTPGITA